MTSYTYPIRKLPTGISISNRDISIEISDEIFQERSTELIKNIKALLGPPRPLLTKEELIRVKFKIKTGEKQSQFSTETHSSKENETIHGNLYFDSFEDKILELNLRKFDSDLPNIIAYFVLVKHRNPSFSLSHIITELRRINPLKFDQSQGHKFYDYKIHRLLREHTWRMTNSEKWFDDSRCADGIISLKYEKTPSFIHQLECVKTKIFLESNLQLNILGTKVDHEVGHQVSEPKEYFYLDFQIKV